MSVPWGDGKRLCSTVQMDSWRTLSLSSGSLERWTGDSKESYWDLKGGVWSYRRRLVLVHAGDYTWNWKEFGL